MGKQLEKFFIAEYLSKKVGQFKPWNVASTISDPLPMCLQLDFGEAKQNFPFKFNHTWSIEDEFEELVISTWIKLDARPISLAMIHMVDNLKPLKSFVPEWEKTKY